jgi:hypothetical protein
VSDKLLAEERRIIIIRNGANTIHLPNFVNIALLCILIYLLHSKLFKFVIKKGDKNESFVIFFKILEYFSLGKGPFTEPWGRLEKFLPFYFRIITSYSKMSNIIKITIFV